MRLHITSAAVLLFIPLLVYAGLSQLVSQSSSLHTTTAIRPQNTQTISLLKAARNSDPAGAVGGGGVSVVGSHALLSEAGPTGGSEVSGSDNDTSSDQISLYVVREGDTLSQIAEMFDVSINTILWANEISDGSGISPGDTLVILPVSGVQHTVKKGETLLDIVKKYDADIEEVRNFNSISEETVLSVGDTLTIPNGEMHSKEETRQHSHSSQVAQTSSAQPHYSGYYRRPVNGGIRTQGHHGYNAIDIGAAPGTEILAAADGVVIVSKGYGWNGGYGKYIVIKHDNGTQTLYAHNSRNIVSVGQQVVQGQVIGYMGSTGKSTGPHVHFEVRGAANPF